MCYFIRHPTHSKGYKFYCPSHGTRILESQIAKFLEFDVNDASITVEILAIINRVVDVIETVVTIPLPPIGINVFVQKETIEAQESFYTIS